MLPSREYFELGFRPLVEDGFDVNTNGLPNESFDFDGFQEVLARHFLRGPVEECEACVGRRRRARPVRAGGGGPG